MYVVTKRLTQWGSKELGDKGLTPIEILRYFYGDDMYINIAPEISGIPSSWPGYVLEIGSSGEKVRQIQEQLNVIAGAYPAIPKITSSLFFTFNPPLTLVGSALATISALSVLVK